MKIQTLVLILATILGAKNAIACPGGAIQINDATVLKAEGIQGLKSGKLLSVKEMLGYHMQDGGSAPPTLSITDMADRETHKVILLGSYQDSGGIISSSYLLKDLKTGKEKLLTIRSNYYGNGVRAKGLAEQPQIQTTPQNGFQNYETAGCN